MISPQQTTGQFFVPHDGGMPVFATAQHQANVIADLNYDLVDHVSAVGAHHLGQTREGVLLLGTEAQAWQLSHELGGLVERAQPVTSSVPAAKVSSFFGKDFERAVAGLRVANTNIPFFKPAPMAYRAA
ncbi:MAG: hypothetical protein J0L77_07645 [Alphaproteobacteria bacterium]|nr:hypothetical protein [Alphaproteobacteria bacterium]